MPCEMGGEEDGIDKGTCSLPLVYLRTLSAPHIRPRRAPRTQNQRQRSSLALHHLQYWNTDPFSQMLKKWLVAGLPKDSSLTAIFDSCHSGTLLGIVSSKRIPYPLSLMLGKTSTITGATMYTGLGSTRVIVEARRLRPRVDSAPLIGRGATKRMSASTTGSSS